jgi:hypothetical protein
MRLTSSLPSLINLWFLVPHSPLSAFFLFFSSTSPHREPENMASDIPLDPNKLDKEDKDALNVLDMEAKEFEKASFSLAETHSLNTR